MSLTLPGTECLKHALNVTSVDLELAGIHLKPRPLLVVSLEGLTPSALGCYGSSWNRTPAIDAIADTGCVWDRWLATDDQPANMFLRMTQDLDQTVNWKDKWQANGSIDLITDVEQIADQF